MCVYMYIEFHSVLGFFTTSFFLFFFLLLYARDCSYVHSDCIAINVATQRFGVSSVVSRMLSHTCKAKVLYASDIALGVQ